MYIYIYMFSSLVSWNPNCGRQLSSFVPSFWSSALGAFRELRWWFPPCQSSCSLAGILLGALVIGACCFCCGALATACLLSSKCRLWIWHCVTSACAIWHDLPAARGPVDRDLMRADLVWTARARLARAYRDGVSAHLVLQGLFDKQAIGA